MSLASQSTSIWRSRAGSGRERASASTASRCRAKDATTRRSGRCAAPAPGSADLAVDQERARPDAGRPESLLAGPRAEQAARAPLPQSRSRRRRSAAGARERGRGRRRRATPARPRASSDSSPRGRANRQQRPFQRGERLGRRAPRDPRPARRTRQRSRARRRGGSGVRARDARRPDRSSQGRPPRPPALARRPSGSRACRSSSRT